MLFMDPLGTELPENQRRFTGFREGLLIGEPQVSFSLSPPYRATHLFLILHPCALETSVTNALC